MCLLQQEPDAASAVFSGVVAACNMEVLFTCRQKLPAWAASFLRAWTIDTVQCVSPELISTHTGSTVTKDELRAELERQEQRYKDVYGGEVTTYAAQPEPERKPWRKRATVQDQAFTQELQKMEKELKAEEP